MAQVAVQRALGDVQLLADRADAQATFAVEGFGRHGGGLSLGWQALGTATDPATRPCGRQTRLSPLADQLALELRQRGEQVEHQAALGVGGVDGVIQAL